MLVEYRMLIPQETQIRYELEDDASEQQKHNIEYRYVCM